MSDSSTRTLWLAVAGIAVVFVAVLGMVAAGADEQGPAPVADADGADPVAGQDAAPAADIQVDAPVLIAADAGLRLERQHWRLGRREGVAWRVQAPRDTALDVVPSSTPVAFRTLLPADDAGTWAAINGGFYRANAAMGLVVSDGTVQTEVQADGGSGILLWGPAPAQVVHRDAWTPGATEALQSVDRLVDAGKNLVAPRPGRPLAARSAVALSDDAVWLVVLVDRRSLDGAPPTDAEHRLKHTVGSGLDLHEFAQYLMDTTGAQQALNMDGAISTQLAADIGDTRLRVWGEHTTINTVVVRGTAAD